MAQMHPYLPQKVLRVLQHLSPMQVQQQVQYWAQQGNCLRTILVKQESLLALVLLQVVLRPQRLLLLPLLYPQLLWPRHPAAFVRL